MDEKGCRGSQPRLLDHYDRKYAGAQAANVVRVSSARAPRNRFEIVVALAGEGGAVLDVGAGSGNVLLTLEDRFEKLVGVELSTVRARELSRLFAGKPKATVRCGPIEAPGILDEEDVFDVIIMSDVVEHLVEPIAALGLLRNHLAPEGRLIICTPNIAKWTRRVKLLLGRFPSTASLDEGLTMYDRRTSTDLHDEGHLHYFTYRSLRRILLERAGYSHVESVGYGGLLPRLVPSMFSDCCVVAHA